MADQVFPHITLPITFTVPAGYVTAEQDSTDEVAACVAAIVAFKKGYRTERPDFGVDDPAFGTVPLGTGSLESDINEWEARANLLIEERDDSVDLGRVDITIHVTTGG